MDDQLANFLWAKFCQLFLLPSKGNTSLSFILARTGIKNAIVDGLLRDIFVDKGIASGLFRIAELAEANQNFSNGEQYGELMNTFLVYVGAFLVSLFLESSDHIFDPSSDDFIDVQTVPSENFFLHDRGLFLKMFNEDRADQSYPTTPAAYESMELSTTEEAQALPEYISINRSFHRETLAGRINLKLIAKNVAVKS